MRKIVPGTIVLLVVILVSACGPAPTPTDVPPGPPTQAFVDDCEPTPVPPAVPAGPPALVVQGLVGQELQLTLDELRALGVEQLTLEHPRSGPTAYEGVRLSKVLAMAAPAGDATMMVLTAADGFSAEVDLAEANACADCLIAIDGAALNMAMPGMASKAWVKTVISIEVK